MNHAARERWIEEHITVERAVDITFNVRVFNRVYHGYNQPQAIVEQEFWRDHLRDAMAFADAHPMAEGEDYKALYMELLYAVGMKHQGETRHQTALKYIKRAEANTDGPSQQARVQEQG